MSVVASRRSRRFRLLALAAIIGIASSTLTQLTVAPERAVSAGANLLCDNNTVYGIIGAAGGGNAVGDLMQINATDGTSTKIGTIAPGSNALGLTKNGTQLWAYQGNSTNVVKYDAVTGTSTSINVGGTAITAIRGGVDPVNNVYYYATGGTPSTIYGYNIGTSTPIGEVGTFTAGKGNNGDLAFGTDGTLYLVDSDQVFSIANVPSTGGTAALTAKLITTLPAGTNSPAIAYSADGYLYLVANTTSSTLYKIDPGTGTVKATLTISTGANVYDLASCNYANSLRTQADVRSRAASTDEFTLTNAGFTTGNTATTTGSATGIQAAVAGPSLAVGTNSYTVTQTVAGTTNLADYSVGWTCVNNTISTTVATGTGNTATFTYPSATTADGSDVVCTFIDALLPVANPDSNTTPVNTAVTSDAAHNLLANDTGASITVVTTGIQSDPSNGSVTRNADGSYVYTPNTDFSGTDSFGYTIADVNGTQASSTATITVTPTAVDDAASTGIDTPLTLSNLTANDHGSNLTVTSVPATSAHGTVSVDGSGVVTYTPAAGYFGSDSFVYTAKDSSGQSATATVNITVSPGAVNDTATTKANSPVTTSVLTANDHANNGVTQSITTPVNGGTAVLNADGTVTYTPPTNYSGPDSFQYTAKDASGALYTGTVNITVNPVAVDDPATTAAETPVTVSNLPGNDIGTATLNVTSITQPSVGSAVLNANGSVTYTPAADFSGTVHIPYTITDPSGGTATADVVVTVTPTGADDAGTTPVNTTLVVPVATGVLANDKGSLSVTSHTTVSHGSVTIAADGSYSYTPTAEYSGPDQFSYVASDSLGQTVTQIVRLTVTPTAADDNATTGVNQPINVAVRSNDHGDLLTITAIGAVTNGTAVVGSGGTIDFTPTTDFSGNATVPYTVTDSAGQQVSAVLHIVVDPSAADDSTTTTINTPVTVSKATLIANDKGTTLNPTSITSQPTNGTAVRNADGSVTYTPNTNYSGPDSFRYQVTDAAGGTATAKVSVVVGNAATPDTGTTSVNTALDVDAANGVLSNDPGTHPLTATIATTPSNGTVTLATDGSYHYVPTQNFSGTDTFQYTATDASGNTAVGTVTITVTPTAANDALTVNAGAVGTVVAPGVLGNDVGSQLSVLSHTAPVNGGSVTISSDGSYTYTPATNYSGPDSFTYIAQDSSGQQVAATVNITVKPVVAAADPTTTAGTPVTVDAAHGLLVGATGTGLTASLQNPPANGTVVVNPDGSYTYTPNPGFTGVDTFTFTVTDSSNQTTSGTASVTVEPLAVAKNDTTTAESGQPITIDPLTNDSATGGQTFDLATLRLIDPATNLSALQVTVPGNGTWSVQGSKLQFTPIAGFVGTASIKYQITDTAGETVTATDSVVYPALTTLAHTGIDAGEFDGMVGSGLGALLLGLLLLLLNGLRRSGRHPRHRAA